MFKKYEDEGDIKMLNNTKNTANSLFVGYLYESQEEYDIKCIQIPHAILCNRNEYPNPCPVIGTRDIFEIQSTLTKHAYKPLNL